MLNITNPILPGFNPDPSILRVEDDYFIASSTFEWFPGVRIHHSRDLVHWRLLTHALTRKSQLDMVGNENSGGVWAPCLSYSGGLFYLIYTDVKNLTGRFVDAHNYLITADNIEGPWSEPTYLNSSGFDPSLFHDENGRKWLLNMIWDYRTENVSGGILIQEYDPKAKKLIGNRKLIFKGTQSGTTEAPHIYKRNGYYYLMTAEGGTEYGHMVTMCRSKHILGPYELDPENPMLTSANNVELALQKAGHASLVETQNGEFYLAHLCGRPLPGAKHCNLGRETAIQRCYWDREGWLRLSNKRHEPSVTVHAPDLPECKLEPDPTQDNFDSEKLNLHFNTLREPVDSRWLSLTERPGYLRLRGRESLTSRFHQSLVARRLKSFVCEVSTVVEFSPENFQQHAGLVCYYNRKNFLYLRISTDEKIGKNLSIIRMDQAKPEYYDQIPIEREIPIFLKVKFNYDSIQFYYSGDQTDWEKTGHEFYAGKLSDDYCTGFTGTFIGLCVQDLSGMGKCADFGFFHMSG